MPNTNKRIRQCNGHPNDECYTPMECILNELNYWGGKGKFKGKSIICPCDWFITTDCDTPSITIEYAENGSYNGDNLSQDQIDDLLKKTIRINFVKALIQNAGLWGIKSITASGYDPTKDRGIPFQNVDYSKYDVCITNPPFSLYGEFLGKLVGNIDFVVLAPFLNRVSPPEAIPMMNHKLYLGHEIHRHVNFVNPTPENQYNTNDALKVVCCDWLTSWPDAQQERNAADYKTGISYETYKDDYQFMENMTMKDGTHPMIVGAGTIPDDYDGWMFAPISILDRLNTDKYDMYCTGCRAYFNKNSRQYNPFAHDLSTDMRKHNGKAKFDGWVFKKKPDKKEEEQDE